GDDFAGRCRADTSGKLLAELIELNVVAVFGVVTKVDGGGDSFEMFTNPKADPQSGYEKKRLRVLVDADTIFTASAKEDIKTGREVQMVGLDLKNGTVRATRLTVYEGNWPVRMPDGKVLPAPGPPKCSPTFVPPSRCSRQRVPDLSCRVGCPISTPLVESWKQPCPEASEVGLLFRAYCRR